MGGGERDLESLLNNLSAVLSNKRYSFEPAVDATLDQSGFALVREDEGLSSIRESVTGEWARISLGVHSSLEAVGLTAALSRRLADAGISVNIVAGLHHDHFFVPWERGQEALQLLGG